MGSCAHLFLPRLPAAPRTRKPTPSETCRRDRVQHDPADGWKDDKTNTDQGIKSLRQSVEYRRSECSIECLKIVKNVHVHPHISDGAHQPVLLLRPSPGSFSGRILSKHMGPDIKTKESSFRIFLPPLVTRPIHSRLPSSSIMLWLPSCFVFHHALASIMLWLPSCFAKNSRFACRYSLAVDASRASTILSSLYCSTSPASPRRLSRNPRNPATEG